MRKFRPDDDLTRCGWALGSANECEYHDFEWGVPLHDDQRLFEFLTLEGAQAGLSWRTILDKRTGYRELFDGFEIDRVAGFTQKKIDQLLLNPAIVRNRLKVESTVSNANRYIKIQNEFGSFDSYIWGFVDHQSIQNRWNTMAEVPASTALSDAISKAMKKRGFRFVGSTIIYAFMQATGMVNDHLTSCFRHQPVKALATQK